MAVDYEVLVGLNYPPDKRAEVGDIVSDLPGKSLTWLITQDFVRPAAAATSATPSEGGA